MESSITFGSIPDMELSFRMEDVTLDDVPESPTVPRVVPQEVTPQQPPRHVVPQRFYHQQTHMQHGQAQPIQPPINSQEMSAPMTKSFSFKVPDVFRLQKGSVVRWLDDVPIPEEDEEESYLSAASAQKQPNVKKHDLDHEMPDQDPEEGGHYHKRARLSIASSTRPGPAKRRGKIEQTRQGFVRRVSNVYQRVISTSPAPRRSASWGTNPFPMQPATPTTPTSPTSPFYRPKISFVVVGDSGCGKSSLLLRYCHNTFHEEYTPTQYEMYNKTAVTAKGEIDIEMWDTSGSIKLHQLQRLSYMRWSGVLLCFNLTDQESFVHAQGKWIKEIGVYCRGAPIILVGLNKDERSISVGLLDPFQPRGTRISAGEGSMAAIGIGAAKYMECSAKTGEGVKRVFDESIRIVLDESADGKATAAAARMAKGKSQARRLGEALCFA